MAKTDPVAREDVLDELCIRIGPLMKFCEQTARPDQVFLKLTDMLHYKDRVEFGQQHEAVSINRYRELVEDLIVELTEHNSFLLKIKNGEQIAPDEVNQIAEMLRDEHPYITEDLLRQVYKNRKAHFIQFIRHILGIEILKGFPDTVSDTFNHFIKQHTNLSGHLLEFLSLLKNLIIERKKIEKKYSINAPFTVIHPQGICRLFSPSEINKILQLTEILET